MKNLKITEGEWKVTTIFNKKMIPAITITSNKLCIWLPFESWSGEKDKAEKTTELIKDSLDIYNETGLTPRELLEQRNELLESLNTMTALCRIKYGNLNEEVYEEILKAEQAIQNTKK